MSGAERKVHVEEDITERNKEQMDYEFEVKNQTYCLLSIIDPEDSTKQCAIKVFGCFPTADAANDAAKKISTECDFFHVYVCPTNAWVPVPPKAASIEDVNYQETRMNEIHETFVALKDRQAKQVIRQLNKEAELEGKEESKGDLVSIEEVEESNTV